MKRYLLILAAVVLGVYLATGLNSCGIADDILDLENVEKSDLTNPLFLAYDNTLDSKTKKVWVFNATEAVQATITMQTDQILTISTKLYFDTWSISVKKITLGDSKTYDMKRVSVLGYDAIAIGGYICIPSTNKSLDGKRYEDDWFSRGLTEQAFWDALRKSYQNNDNVQITLNK